MEFWFISTTITPSVKKDSLALKTAQRRGASATAADDVQDAEIRQSGKKIDIRSDEPVRADQNPA